MEIERITKEELKGKVDRKEDLTIIDVRNPVDYAKSSVKIAGAVRIPVEELEKRCVELDPKKEAVAYCT